MVLFITPSAAFSNRGAASTVGSVRGHPNQGHCLAGITEAIRLRESRNARAISAGFRPESNAARIMRSCPGVTAVSRRLVRDVPGALSRRSARRIHELQAALDPVEPFTLIVQTKVHVGHVRLEIRQTAFHGGHAMAHITELAFQVAKRGTNGAKMLEDRITRSYFSLARSELRPIPRARRSDGRSNRIVSASCHASRRGAFGQLRAPRTREARAHANRSASHSSMA